MSAHTSNTHNHLTLLTGDLGGGGTHIQEAGCVIGWFACSNRALEETLQDAKAYID